MKKFLKVLLIILFIPIIAIGILYFFVDPVKEMTDDVLKYLPGSLGESFRNKPTTEEISGQILEVANYILDYEDERAVDKLQLQKAKDEKTYELLIKQMMRLNPNKTSRLLELVRESELSESPLQETLEKIKQENADDIREESELISKLLDAEKIKAIQAMIDADLSGYDKVARIFENLGEDDVLMIMSYLKEDDREIIFNKMDKEKSYDYETKLLAKMSSMKLAKEAAELLASKTPEELSTLIGPGSKYKPTELADIYRYMGPKKAGLVLSKIDSVEFKQSIISDVKKREKLLNGKDKISEDLILSLKIYKEFADNLTNLKRVYGELDDKKLAQTVKTLYWGSDNKKVYELSNGETIEITDKELAIELLKGFDDKKTANILSNLDNRLSSEIFTKLALPNLE